MSSSFRAPPIPSSDEIDLVALFQAVWKQKKLIMAATASAGLVAAIYAFLTTPQYEVSSVLRPAAINELDALNRSEIYTLPPGDALVRVGASLESYDTRLGFSVRTRSCSRPLNSQAGRWSRVSKSSIATLLSSVCLIRRRPTPSVLISSLK